MQAFIFVLSVLAFACLAAAISRHGQVLLRRAPTAAQQQRLRLAGWSLLLLTVIVCCLGWQADVGLVMWLGWLTVAGLLLVLAISYWPGQAAPAGAKKRRPDSRTDQGEALAQPQTLFSLPETAPVAARGGAYLLLTVALLLPLMGFSRALQQMPEPPLQRDDALHGQLGSWTYVLAETHQHREPEAGPRGQLQKSFTIRFCDLCNGEIQTIQLNVGKPPSAQRAGTPFIGRGQEKIAELAITGRARAGDDLWLTVTDYRGQVQQQALSMARVSPALARYLAARPASSDTAEQPGLTQPRGRGQPESAGGGRLRGEDEGPRVGGEKRQR